MEPEEPTMFVIAESDATIVRLKDRFDASHARSLADLLALFRPVGHVIIDFGPVRDVDDAAISDLARSLRAHPESRVTFRGLSRHLRRLLRYLGLGESGAGGPAPAEAARP
jgi:anti-anti-sigma regulatory factor